MKNDTTDKPQHDIFATFLDNNIENKLFKSKYLVLLAIVGSLILATALFLVGIYETFVAVINFFNTNDIKQFTIYVLKSADLFLFGMVMIIFALGSYNLFISPLDNIDVDEKTGRVLPDWLSFKNFGELKALFIKVIVLILSITFLEQIIININSFANKA